MEWIVVFVGLKKKVKVVFVICLDGRKRKKKKGFGEKNLKIISLGVFKRENEKENNGNERILFLLKHLLTFSTKSGMKWKENSTTFATKN